MPSTKKVIVGLVLGLVLSLGLAGGVIDAVQPKKAQAQTAPTTVHPTGSVSINTETTIATAAAGTHLNLKAMLLTSSGAGVVVFKDGTGGTTIANIYLAANTPLLVGQDVFGAAGIQQSSTVLTATLSGATLTYLIRSDQH